jgi:hypothetical protein
MRTQKFEFDEQRIKELTNEVAKYIRIFLRANSYTLSEKEICIISSKTSACFKDNLKSIPVYRSFIEKMIKKGLISSG